MNINHLQNQDNLYFRNNITNQNTPSYVSQVVQDNNSKSLLNKKTLDTINNKYNNFLILNFNKNNLHNNLHNNLNNSLHNNLHNNLYNKNNIVEINNNNFSRYIKNGSRILYIKNNRIKKGKVNRILTNNIIELCRGKKTWFIYLHKYIILVEKDNSLRSILEDIVSNKFTIS